MLKYWIHTVLRFYVVYRDGTDPVPLVLNRCLNKRDQIIFNTTFQKKLRFYIVQF